VYLNAIKDLFNSEIVARQISWNCDADLCCTTISNLADIVNLWGAIVHTDCGSTYTAKEYRKSLKDLHSLQSMSRPGKCEDNASMESFFAVLKSEALYAKFGKLNVKQGKIPVRQIIDLVEKFIDYYNHNRLQERLEWLSPVDYLRANPLGTLPVISKNV